jgi:hypothetical protein
MTSEEVEAIIDLINATHTHRVGTRWLREHGLQDTEAWEQCQRLYRQAVSRLHAVAQDAAEAKEPTQWRALPAPPSREKRTEPETKI